LPIEIGWVAARPSQAPTVDAMACRLAREIRLIDHAE
jgi:hypothetical protein